MYDLTTFGLPEMTMAGAQLRRLGRDARTLESASQQVARFFCDEFVDSPTGKSSFVLARCYKTHPLNELPRRLEAFARNVFPDRSLEVDTQCLTLLGSYGEEPAWRSRQGSSGHQAIPLASEHIVESLPMVARLTQALGLEARQLVHPDPSFLLEKDRAGFNVFHVEHALGSPYIPAQDGFVRGFAVRSVVGFGFAVPPSYVYATILFARQHIPPETAEMFKTLALSLKLALLPLVTKPVFENEEG